jgi:hypothetical protein
MLQRGAEQSDWRRCVSLLLFSFNICVLARYLVLSLGLAYGESIGQTDGGRREWVREAEAAHPAWVRVHPARARQRVRAARGFISPKAAGAPIYAVSPGGGGTMIKDNDSIAGLFSPPSFFLEPTILSLECPKQCNPPPLGLRFSFKNTP